MSEDLVNGLFEIVGAYFVWMNAYVLYKEQEIKGIFWQSWAFFAAWGMWNLYYYPSLDQWISFYAGIILVTGNVAWVVMAVQIKYKFGFYKEEVSYE